MVAANVIAADTDAEARRLFTSLQQSFTNIFRAGAAGYRRRSTTSRPTGLRREGTGVSDDAPLLRRRTDTVRRALEGFVDETGADELIVAAAIYDHVARLTSYEILAGIRNAPP